MRAILVVLVALLTACAADPQRVEAPAQVRADELAPPTTSLSSFAEFKLKPMSIDEAIEANKGTRGKAQELEKSLGERLSPLLESWHAAGTEGAGDSLLIETKLISMRIISKATRQFTPAAVVGKSHIYMDLRLTNAATGNEIANVEIRARATQWGSAYSGVSDDTLDEYVVAVVYKYLSDNY